MKTNRRTFLQSSAVASIGIGVAGCSNSSPSAQAQAQTSTAPSGVHPAIAGLKPMTADVKPITRDERAARVQKAQRLMSENKISAIYLEGGSSMFYFTGVRWGLSERPFVAVIPARGDIAWVCPGFEEARARELVAKDAEVRVWQEDESPYRQRSEEHTSELQSPCNLVCRLLLEKKNRIIIIIHTFKSKLFLDRHNICFRCTIAIIIANVLGLFFWFIFHT